MKQHTQIYLSIFPGRKVPQKKLEWEGNITFFGDRNLQESLEYLLQRISCKNSQAVIGRAVAGSAIGGGVCFVLIYTKQKSLLL